MRKEQKSNGNSQNKSRKRSSQRRSFKGKDCNTQERDLRDAKSAGNDPEWYDTNPSLTTDAANLSFMYAAGQSFNLNDPNFSGETLEWPGVIALYLTPSVGKQVTPTDPLNIASMQQFTFVRKNKAGNLPFDAPDLMVMTLAMADVYSYLNYLIRAYATVQLYTMQNNHIPNTLLQAMGIDAADLRANLPQFRWGVNLLIEQAAAIAVPANVKLYRRRAFLYQNLYTEGTSIKDQIYMYSPFAFGKFNPGLSADSGSFLEMVRFYDPITYPNGRNVAQLIQYGQELLYAVFENADVQSMSAFNLEAYGVDGIMKLQVLSEVVPIVPVFNITVLEQFKNADVASSSFTDWGAGTNSTSLATFNVTQDTTKGYLQSRPTLLRKVSSGVPNEVGALVRYYQRTKILSTTTDKTDSGLVMENSRLMFGGDLYYVDDPQSPYPGYMGLELQCGTEVAFACLAWRIDEAGTIFNNGNLASYYAVVGTPTEANLTTIYRTMSDRESFKFCPSWTLYLLDGAPSFTPNIYYTYWDVDNFTLIDEHELELLHRTALLSLLNVQRY